MSLIMQVIKGKFRKSLLAYFCYDERLSVLQSSFQRESPRSASVKLDVDVIKGDELLHGLHAGSGTFSIEPHTSHTTNSCLSITNSNSGSRGMKQGRGEERRDVLLRTGMPSFRVKEMLQA